MNAPRLHGHSQALPLRSLIADSLIHHGLANVALSTGRLAGSRLRPLALPAVPSSPTARSLLLSQALPCPRQVVMPSATPRLPHNRHNIYGTAYIHTDRNASGYPDLAPTCPNALFVKDPRFRRRRRRGSAVGRRGKGWKRQEKGWTLRKDRHTNIRGLAACAVPVKARIVAVQHVVHT